MARVALGGKWGPKCSDFRTPILDPKKGSFFDLFWGTPGVPPGTPKNPPKPSKTPKIDPSRGTPGDPCFWGPRGWSPGVLGCPAGYPRGPGGGPRGTPGVVPPDPGGDPGVPLGYPGVPRGTPGGTPGSTPGGRGWGRRSGVDPGGTPLTDKGSDTLPTPARWADGRWPTDHDRGLGSATSATPTRVRSTEMLTAGPRKNGGG